ncbi:MAG: hypothetical protein ACUVWX_11280, partial [Kiritimatiellia bacterium]
KPWEAQRQGPRKAALILREENTECLLSEDRHDPHGERLAHNIHSGHIFRFGSLAVGWRPEQGCFPSGSYGLVGHCVQSSHAHSEAFAFFLSHMHFRDMIKKPIQTASCQEV